MAPITSLNVVCVKTGTKYNHVLVNRLYTMVCRYLSIPFTFYCYTDDPQHIDPHVNIIPYKDYYLDGVWNKLCLFQQGFGNLTGKCLFFDLDLALLNNIDYIINSRSFSSLCFIKAQWRNPQDEYKYFLMLENPKHKIPPSQVVMMRNVGRINSSMILWEADTQNHIWDHFIQNPEYYMNYYLGIDRFIVHEGFNHDTFPSEGIYSFIYGDDYRNNPKKAGHVYPEMSICLFNGPKETSEEKQRFDQAINSFKGYWS